MRHYQSTPEKKFLGMAILFFLIPVFLVFYVLFVINWRPSTDTIIIAVACALLGLFFYWQHKKKQAAIEAEAIQAGQYAAEAGEDYEGGPLEEGEEGQLEEDFPEELDEEAPEEELEEEYAAPAAKPKKPKNVSPKLSKPKPFPKKQLKKKPAKKPAAVAEDEEPEEADEGLAEEEPDEEPEEGNAEEEIDEGELDDKEGLEEETGK